MYRSAAAFSFPKREKVPKKNFLTSSYGKPDAGEYNKEILHKTNTGYHFLKGAKLKTPKSITPGVGHYDITNRSTVGPKYSEYQHNKITTFGELVTKKTRQKTPGPGRYDSQMSSVKPRTVLGKFSTMKKDINYDNKKPGVGKYDPKTSKEFGKGDKNKFTIPKSQRSNIIDKTKTSSSVRHQNDIKALDPGYYKLQPTFGTGGTKVLLRGKPPDKIRSKTPGPDKYRHEDAKIKTLRNAPKYGIGMGKKMSILKKENNKEMGPGKYTLKAEFDVSDKSRIKANTFSKAPRMKVKRPKTPGPGEYKIPYSFGYTAPYSGIENKFV